MAMDPASPDFIYPLEAVRGGDAAKRLAELRRELAGSGRVPVILGDRNSVESLKEVHEFNTEDVIVPGHLNEDPVQWFRDRMAEDPEAFEGMVDDDFDPEAAAPMHSLAVGFDHRGKERDEIWIATVDAEHSWELPLKLGYGAWNSCPGPEEHALVAKYWALKYGAEIAAVTSDTVEFTVARPPVSKEACDELAKEMFVYCTDIVDQGVGSVPTLSKCVEGSTVWFFWWD
jgi:hypothetical protein